MMTDKQLRGIGAEFKTAFFQNVCKLDTAKLFVGRHVRLGGGGLNFYSYLSRRLFCFFDNFRQSDVHVVFSVVRSFNLAWGLIFGEVKLLLDFRLAGYQFVIPLFLLERRTHLGLQFGCALLRILDVGFQPPTRSSNPCTVDSSERMVPSAVSVTRVL